MRGFHTKAWSECETSCENGVRRFFLSPIPGPIVRVKLARFECEDSRFRRLASNDLKKNTRLFAVNFPRRQKYGTLVKETLSKAKAGFI